MKRVFLLFGAAAIWVSCGSPAGADEKLTPVDYVNPYMGNISHLLVPTYPTVHLPGSMLRVYPERGDFTGDVLHGLPLVVTSHRGASAFNLSPRVEGEELTRVRDFSYDNEEIRPYYYGVTLDEQQTEVRFAPSHRSAVYEMAFSKPSPGLVFNAADGGLAFEGGAVRGWQALQNGTKVWIHAEFDTAPASVGSLSSNGSGGKGNVVAWGANGETLHVIFPEGTTAIRVNYGISFIDADQARDNMRREVEGKSVDEVAAAGKKIWNDALSKIEVAGTDETDKTIFYTSLYRCFERPVCISEYGRYFSAFDGTVHDDEGTPFYTDDWIWDTYRATHPLRILIDPATETDILGSFIRMAEQMPNMWMPTFPEITGDSRRMNSNHAVITFADAIVKGLDGFDLAKAYEAARAGIMDKTLAPWSGAPAGTLDRFYHANGYIPALAVGETETVPEVHDFEKRQPVAVTLGTSYDQWALALLARELGKAGDEEYFGRAAYNYRNVFNPETGFFHPRDARGNFIAPFDYRWSGGLGAREAYGENNGWLYRWDVQHHLADLVSLMGGAEEFDTALDAMYREPLGMGKYRFYSMLPDHTGNVGQFSMANEPSLHIPYLYVYAGKPWKTQKRIHTLMRQWFRNDLMGMPGDEDGGGMSAFVVFSMMGFYPVTPGLPMYVIGSPFFERSTVSLADGKTFTVTANGYSEKNKYIQSATLNGEALDRSWFTHEELMRGGELVLEMGPAANHTWAAGITPPTGENQVVTQNPFVTHMYTADPSAHVWEDGRLYVYASHDIYPAFGCDMMDQYHVFSTDDMVNWTDHGQILEAADVPWGEPLVMDPATGREGKFMWAPDCAYKDGKYYFYFPHPSGPTWNDTWKIGIAVSDSPASGFVCLDHTLIGLPEKGEIDPCVFVDDDGQAYFYYGGGGRCFGARLKENMVELDGELQPMEGLVDFHEAAWVHKRDGVYYMSYSDNHDENWNDGVAGDNRMRYATSDSPLGPWEYRGIYMEPTDSYTNHGSIVEYKGQWWAFYHNSNLSRRNGHEPADWLRSVCADPLFFNPDGTIRPVKQTSAIAF